MTKIKFKTLIIILLFNAVGLLYFMETRNFQALFLIVFSSTIITLKHFNYASRVTSLIDNFVLIIFKVITLIVITIIFFVIFTPIILAIKKIIDNQFRFDKKYSEKYTSIGTSGTFERYF